MPNCKICSSETRMTFSASVLKKYTVNYFKCSYCGFIQTEEPYWLDEAYSNAITRLDIGLIYRNRVSVSVTQSVIGKWFRGSAQFVDYGGGYGMLVRMLRDQGYNFFRYDPLCENLFARGFDVDDINFDKNYELLTAFEVFEHLVDPHQELQKMLSYSRSILFSTEVQPTIDVSPNSWWYIAPEIGQHVALHSEKSLNVLAEMNNLYYYRGHKNNNMHLITDRKISRLWFQELTNWRSAQFYNILTQNRRPSLLDRDFQSLISKAI
jgi:hypothetical protein